MKKETENFQGEIQINYIKGPLYRQVHCDGLLVTITPEQDLNMLVYAERPVLPKGVKFEFSEKGEMVGEVEELDGSLRGFTREIEFGIYIGLSGARKLHETLGKLIETLEEDD